MYNIEMHNKVTNKKYSIFLPGRLFGFVDLYLNGEIFRSVDVSTLRNGLDEA